MDSSGPESTNRPGWLDSVRDVHRRSDDGTLPIGLISYGSLLHPEEINNLFGKKRSDQHRVRVDGFQRLFNKRIAGHFSRETEPDKEGVLNLTFSEGSWFNGLLVYPVRINDFKQYAFREREYDLVEVDPSDVEYYTDRPSAGLERIEAIYTCLLEDPDETKSSLEPVPSYLELCLDGAREHGDVFERDFLKSTRVGERTLKEYMDD